MPVFLWMAANKRLVWGEWDCALWLADWYRFGTGKPDPVADWRGKYHDAESARALCGPLGFPRMIQRMAERAGLERTRDPIRGDIGIIRTRPGNVIVGAIRANSFWTFPHERGGIASINPREPALRILMAWRILSA